VPQSGEGSIQRLLPRDLLEQLYVTERRTAAWIGEHYGAHRATVGRLIREYGLVKPATGPGVAAQIDPDELYRMHNVERLPAEEIGRRLGVATATAYLWMRRYGVPRRARTLRQAASTPPPTPWIGQASLVALWEEGWTGAQAAHDRRHSRRRP
jgi:hypothetical protein